jgi:hypothetical protein
MHTQGPYGHDTSDTKESECMRAGVRRDEIAVEERRREREKRASEAEASRRRGMGGREKKHGRADRARCCC